MKKCLKITGIIVCCLLVVGLSFVLYLQIGIPMIPEPVNTDTVESIGLRFGYDDIDYIVLTPEDEDFEWIVELSAGLRKLFPRPTKKVYYGGSAHSGYALHMKSGNEYIIWDTASDQLFGIRFPIIGFKSGSDGDWEYYVVHEEPRKELRNIVNKYRDSIKEAKNEYKKKR